MSGLCFRRNNSNISLTQSYYTSPNTGTMRLCIRDNNGNIVRYGLTTYTSASKNSPTFRISDKNCYIGYGSITKTKSIYYHRQACYYKRGDGTGWDNDGNSDYEDLAYFGFNNLINFLGSVGGSYKNTTRYTSSSVRNYTTTYMNKTLTYVSYNTYIDILYYGTRATLSMVTTTNYASLMDSWLSNKIINKLTPHGITGMYYHSISSYLWAGRTDYCYSNVISFNTWGNQIVNIDADMGNEPYSRIITDWYGYKSAGQSTFTTSPNINL